MFQIIDECTTANPDGVTVELEHESLRFSEDGRTLTIPLEFVYGEGVLVYAPSIRTWDVPHRVDAISSIERVRILRLVSEALDTLGVKHRIDE